MLVPHQKEIQSAAAAIEAGGVVCVPTETGYGLAVAYDDPTAMKALFKAKGRDMINAPVALIAATSEQTNMVVEQFSFLALRLAQRYWPGPLTMVLSAKKNLLPEIVNGQGNVGIRISSHPCASLLALSVGKPITATSANRSGESICCDIQEAKACFGDLVSVYLDGGWIDNDGFSTVITVEGEHYNVLRQGVINLLDSKEYCDG